MQLKTRRSNRRWPAVIAYFVSAALSASNALAAPTLTDRERTFLKIVFSGDEAKAVEYAELAGINANAIGGQPLSVWFYDSTDFLHRSLRVQKIVFERFKQKPNPPLREIAGIRNYCAYAPYPQNMMVDTSGTPAQRQALQEQQFAAQKIHIDAMVAGFESLRRYGLSDRKILTAMLPNCVYPMPGPASEYIYDNLVTKLLQAGADINTSNPGGRTYGQEGRAIQQAVGSQNDAVVERLLRDGAQVQFPIPVLCEDKVTNLYGYSLSSTRPAKPERLVKIIGMLNAAGLPASKPVVAPPGVGFTYCKRTTIYDEALNAGNLELAKALKNAIETTTPINRTAAVKLPAQPSSTPATTPTQQTMPTTQIGAWRVGASDGRVYAQAKADGKTSNGFAALRFECVGGKLEYIPVALKLNGPITSLWVSVAGDAKEMKLVNQRASGPSATILSNEFAALEQEAKQNSTKDWGVELTVQSANHVGDNVVMTGFSEMRAYMRANCKN